MGLTKPQGCQLRWTQSREHRGPSLTSPKAVAGPQFSQAWPPRSTDVQPTTEGAASPIPCQLCSPLGAGSLLQFGDGGL